ncbi:MAG: 23S rRNA (uracil(1939)-C(5))-methyltransferase RlmD [Victivallaceae bacterium]
MDDRTIVCPYYGSCGGCSYPHDTYFKDGIDRKEKDLLSLFSNLLEANSNVHPLIPCSQPKNFRNKMEFSFSDTLSGERYLGLLSLGQPKRTLNIDSCLLADRAIIRCLQITRNWWDRNPKIRSYYAPKNKGSLCSLTVRKSPSTQELMVILTTSGNPQYTLNEKTILSLVEDLKNGAPLTSFIWRKKYARKGVPTSYIQSCLYGKDYIIIDVDLPETSIKHKFVVKPDAFFQPNNLQFSNLFKTILTLAELRKDQVLFDLFCGSGTIGIMLAPFVKQVIGVELNKDAVCSANMNLVINRIESMTVEQNDVKSFIRGSSLKPDVLILDPPRSGLQSKIIKYLLRFDAPKIIYVSCNPKTQFADCRELVDAGYRITAMQPIDQFPYSPHLENIAVLQKDSSVTLNN